MATKGEQLTKALRAAKAAAIAADPGPEADGGTCNFDQPAFFTRLSQRTVESAARCAGVEIYRSTWWGRRCFFVQVMQGQGSRRTVMAEAASKALEAAAPEGTEVSTYYRMD